MYKNGAEEPEVIKVKTEKYLYGAEADAVARGIGAGKAIFPTMSCDDTLALMRSLDRWREQIGLRYDGE